MYSIDSAKVNIDFLFSGKNKDTTFIDDPRNRRGQKVAVIGILSAPAVTRPVRDITVIRKQRPTPTFARTNCLLYHSFVFVIDFLIGNATLPTDKGFL